MLRCAVLVAVLVLVARVSGLVRAGGWAPRPVSCPLIPRCELAERLEALEALLGCISVNGSDIIITDCNLRIQSSTPGLGNLAVERSLSGNTLGGFGNVIVGDNHIANGDRGLFVGSGHESGAGSFGAALLGERNVIAAGVQFGAVTGGRGSAVEGHYSSISGGGCNTVGVGVEYGSISGGGHCTDGLDRTDADTNQILQPPGAASTEARYAHISGGAGNRVLGEWGAAVGGQRNTVNCKECVGVGGQNNVVGNLDGTVQGNEDQENVIVGGARGNIQHGSRNVIVGGQDGSIGSTCGAGSGDHNVVVGQNNNNDIGCSHNAVAGLPP